MPHATGSRGLQAPAPAGLLRVRRPSGVPPAGAARDLVRYLWASPNTLLGLGFAALAVAGGELRVVGGVLEAHGPLLRWILTHLVPLRGGALAVTLGHVVVACDARALDETRDHERAHMVQCERWGPWFIPAYLSASLWALARGRDPYLDNAFEREAFAVERRGRGLKAEPPGSPRRFIGEYRPDLTP